MAEKRSRREKKIMEKIMTFKEFLTEGGIKQATEKIYNQIKPNVEKTFKSLGVKITNTDIKDDKINLSFDKKVDNDKANKKLAQYNLMLKGNSLVLVK